jgi:hypothetical protein
MQDELFFRTRVDLERAVYSLAKFSASFIYHERNGILMITCDDDARYRRLKVTPWSSPMFPLLSMSSGTV